MSFLPKFTLLIWLQSPGHVLLLTCGLYNDGHRSSIINTDNRAFDLVGVNDEGNLRGSQARIKPKKMRVCSVDD